MIVATFIMPLHIDRAICRAMRGSKVRRYFRMAQFYKPFKSYNQIAVG